jgi:polyisoprenyl-phosphate glycosyltransferase
VRASLSQHAAEPTTPLLSIVVPVYRSAEILPLLVAQTELALKGTDAEGRFEMVLVCDASPDSSWQVIESLARQHAYVRGVDLRRNAGQHNATMAGLHYAGGRYVVIMDDDLQHPPAAIPRMLAVLADGYDVCYAQYLHRQHPLWKRLGSAFNNVVATWLLDKRRDLYLSSFKALDGEVVAEVIRYEGPYAYLDGLILDVTRSITSIDIEHQPRASGTGNYGLRRSLSLWFKMATSFSVAPLRVLSLLGALLGMASLLMIGCIIVIKLRDPSIPAGWASLIATVLFMGGTQLVGLGLLGEYLGRTYLTINRKPQFVVRETTWTRRPQCD